MTDVFGPFDGINWTQDAWYRHAPKWAPSGVNGTPAASTTTGDLPITFSGLNFTIGIGRGWVRGAGFERSGSPASQTIAANTNASLFRRDRVVLRRDLAAKTLAPVLIQGTASSSPTAPAIQQSETGQWDLPLFSFLTPPNSGTTITGIVDERGFIAPANGGVPAFATTTTGRDAYFPSPAAGQTCIAAGAEHRYDGSGWHWSRRGSTGPVSSDAGGLIIVTHGLGAIPTGVLVTPGPQFSDLLNRIVDFVWLSSDATNFVVGLRRDDTNVWLPSQSTQFSWEAWV